MKLFSILLVAIIAWSQATLAQSGDRSPPARPDITAQQQAMERISFMTGKWRGDGWVLNGDSRYEFRQTEHVRYNLDGAILLIDGRGFSKDGAADAEPYFSAFAVVSFNDRKEKYQFQSYSRGYAGTYDASVMDDGGFEWLVGSSRYRIWLTEDEQWFEIGERRQDNGEWAQFFEMTLTRSE